ncbi:MAG: HK97 gp10 family phage protein [candidate division WOR-3 bacterium]
MDISEIREQMGNIGRAAPRILSNALSAGATPVNSAMKDKVPVVTGLLRKSIGKTRGMKESGAVSVNILVRPDFVKRAGTEYESKNPKTGKVYKRKTKRDVPVYFYGVPLIKRRKINEEVMNNTRDVFMKIFNQKLGEELTKFRTKYRIV